MEEWHNLVTPYEAQFNSYWLRIYSIPSGVSFDMQKDGSDFYIAMPDTHQNIPWCEWDDNNPDQVRKITLDRDMTLVAIFEQITEVGIFQRLAYDEKIFVVYIPKPPEGKLQAPSFIECPYCGNLMTQNEIPWDSITKQAFCNKCYRFLRYKVTVVETKKREFKDLPKPKDPIREAIEREKEKKDTGGT